LSESKNQVAHYPVSEQFKVLEGFDIYRSARLIVALVVVESKFGKDLRMYRWQLRGDNWKVDLCRMSVSGWDWATLASKARELIEKHQIKKQSD
jgi:hypothetical protein